MALFCRHMKAFFMKEDYDFGRPDINLYNFHPQLRVFYMLNGIFFNNKDSKLRFIMPVIHSGIVLCALGIELMLIYRGVVIKDYSFAAEAFCYVMILGTAPIVYASTLYNNNLIISLLDAMNGDFIYIRDLEPRYRDAFVKGQLRVWQMSWSWISLCTVAAVVYIGNGFMMLLYQSIFVTPNEHIVRPLIFPLWLPYDDPYRSPNYEIFMFFEIWIILIINQSFAAYVYMQFHILLHYYNLMDMIILDLDVVFDGLDETVLKLPKRDLQRMQVQGILNSRIKRIVHWHLAVYRAMGMVSSVYGPPLAYQVIISSITISIIAFEVVHSIEQGRLHIFFCILWFEACLQLWIPCYLGSLVRDKALSIADACWNCGWHETALGRLICVDFLIIMLRAQQSLTIKFTGLPTLTLETYSSIMSTAYSYFTMLRQSTKN